MISAQTIEKLDEMLSSREYLKYPDYVTDQDINALRAALIRLPEDSLLELIDTKPLFLFASNESLVEVGLPSTALGGFNKPQSYSRPHPFEGRYGFYISSDVSQDELDDIIAHEGGHALDYRSARVAGSEKDFLSDDNEEFKEAVNRIFEHGKFKDVLTVSAGLGRTFQEHAGIYDEINRPDAIYREFAAEAFAKYTHLQNSRGPVDADKVLTEAYEEAWTLYKTQINPAIAEHIEAYAAQGITHHRQACIEILLIEDQIEISPDRITLDLQGMDAEDAAKINKALYSLGIEYELISDDGEGDNIAVTQPDSLGALTTIIEGTRIIEPIKPLAGFTM